MWRLSELVGWNSDLNCCLERVGVHESELYILF
jgi:hypothetical protein